MQRLNWVLLLSMASALAVAQGPTFGAQRGSKAPPFIMTTTAGRRLTNASLRGKVVLLDFWATWCGPCKMASPAMQKLSKAFGRRGLVVIGANTFERQPGPQNAKGYAKEHHYSYLFTYNNDGLAQSFGIQSIPAFVLIDRHGVVREEETGVPPGGAPAIYAFFAKVAKPLLAKK